MTIQQVIRFGPFRQCSCGAAAVLLALAGLWLTGCQSNKPGSSSTASVTIEGRPLSEITSATRAVFLKQGYQGGRTAAFQMTFTAPGSRMDKLAYGDWVGGGNVTVKAIVNFQELGPGSILVSCNGEYITDPGDAILQDTHKIPRVGGARFQKLLDELKDQLK